MVQVIAESTFIDMLVYLCVGLFIAFVGVVIGWIVQEFWRTPTEAKQIRKASNKKKPLLFLVGDDGLAQIGVVDKRDPEGVARTEEKGKLKLHFTGMYPRRTDAPLILAPEVIEQDTQTNGGTAISDRQSRTEGIAAYITSLNIRPTFLQNAKTAFGIAYQGKAIITTIAALAGIDVLDKMKALYPKDMIFVDVTAIKQHFSNNWNESQIDANETRAEKEGQLKANRGRDQKWWILPVLSFGLVLIGIAAILAVIKFL